MKLLSEVDKAASLIQVALPGSLIGVMQFCRGTQVDELQAMVLHLPECGCYIFSTAEFRTFGQVHLPQ